MLSARERRKAGSASSADCRPPGANPLIPLPYYLDSILHRTTETSRLHFTSPTQTSAALLRPLSALTVSDIATDVNFYRTFRAPTLTNSHPAAEEDFRPTPPNSTPHTCPPSICARTLSPVCASTRTNHFTTSGRTMILDCNLQHQNQSRCSYR